MEILVCVKRVPDSAENEISKYQSGYGSITMKYRTGATQAACEAASYSTDTVPVASDGYFQVRLEA